MEFFVFIILLGTIILPIVYYFLGERKEKRFKKSLVFNIIAFFSVLLVATIVLFSGNVIAAESVGQEVNGLGLIAAALSVGISGIGAGIAVAASSSSAIAALSENESIMGKALIFVALGEGIALYGLVIAFMILSRV